MPPVDLFWDGCWQPTFRHTYGLYVCLFRVREMKAGCVAVISFLVDGVRFNFRAAAVIVDDGHVLLHRAVHEDFWSLPGGRVEAGESSAATIVRELAEELGPTLDARIERSLWVAENFFTYVNVPTHELGIYYLVMLGASSHVLAKDQVFDGIEDDLPLHEGERMRLIFQWFPLDALGDLPLYPTFLRERLIALPATLELVTHTDNGIL